MYTILLAGGGTLGSVSPLLAIAEAIPEAEYVFVGTKHGIEQASVMEAGIPYHTIPSVKLRRYKSIRNIIDAFKFPAAIFAAVRILRATRPTIIITAGSFVAVPLCIVGRTFGIPIVLHQQDIEVGLANKIARYFATVITLTFEHQRAHWHNKRTVVTGNPVRRRIRVASPVPEKNEILILGGSLGATQMNNQIRAILPALCERYSVVHVLGKKNFSPNVFTHTNYQPLPFLGRNITEYLSRARIVITRGGLSTLTELAYLKKAAIIIPIPNSHQEVNARFFAQQSTAILLPQTEISMLPERINDLMGTDNTRREMSESLHALFKPLAHETYRALIDKLHPLPTNRTAYFVGIGGIGISALALYFRAHGYQIAGSDIAENEVTRRLAKHGCEIFYGHNAQNIPDATTIVIYSTAVPSTNVELAHARRFRLPLFSYKEYLGIVSSQFNTVAVSGTHGKTTTTAMLGHLLATAHQDPTVIVGAFIPQFNDQNFRKGASDTLVLEADEYRSDMLRLNPKTIVLTNIEMDHTDFYKDIDHIIGAFRKFVGKLGPNDLLIKNADDERMRNIRAPRTISYGCVIPADYTARIDRVIPGQQEISFFHHERLITTCALKIPGAFNVSNALACVAYAHHSGISSAHIREGLSTFTGAWRRFELTGSFKGCPVYSDYAHHPTAVIKTIDAIRSFYPDHKLCVVYQPHSYARTFSMQKEFVNAFAGADLLLLTEIYDVAGRDTDKRISGSDLFHQIKHPKKWYAPTSAAVAALLDELSSPPMVIAVMGAGDIDTVARTIVL